MSAHAAVSARLVLDSCASYLADREARISTELEAAIFNEMWNAPNRCWLSRVGLGPFHAIHTRQQAIAWLKTSRPGLPSEWDQILSAGAEDAKRAQALRSLARAALASAPVSADTRATITAWDAARMTITSADADLLRDCVSGVTP